MAQNKQESKLHAYLQRFAFAGLFLAGAAHAQRPPGPASPAWPSDGVNIVFDGDSISKGFGASVGKTPDQQLRVMLRRPSIVSDVAVSGMPVFKSLERYQQFVAPLYRADAPFNVIAFHGGDNDIAAHRTPEQTYAAFTRYVQLAHAQGYKVIVSTELQRTTWPPEWQMFLSQYNRYLLGNRAHADAVVDLAGAPGLRDPAQRANPRFFFHDRIHLSDNGYHILASMILGAMNKLIPPGR